MLEHDYYQRRFLQLAEQSVALGQAQALALGGIGSSMAWLMSEMDELRRTHTASLALQQAVLQREILQEWLEEFIYQSQKMITAFQHPKDQSSPVSKALLIRSFFLSVKNAGISTGAIRGIQNKEAFDKCLDQAKSLYRRLGTDPEVRKAIANEQAAEKLRIESEQRREAEETRRIEQARKNAPATVVLFRTPTTTGSMYDLQAAVGGESKGRLACDQSIVLQVAPGEHLIKVSGGMLSKSLRLTVRAGERLELETYFSNWGLLGGGLILKPAE